MDVSQLTIFHSMASKLHFAFRNRCLGLSIVLCALMLCAGPSQTVLSHGILLESFPTHGSVLQASPHRVVLHFNATLEPSITQVNLVDLQKVLTPLGVTNASTRDTIVAKIPPLQPGVYNVQYKVLATDGHVTEGFIRFTVIIQ